MVDGKEEGDVYVGERVTSAFLGMPVLVGNAASWLLSRGIGQRVRCIDGISRWECDVPCLQDCPRSRTDRVLGRVCSLIVVTTNWLHRETILTPTKITMIPVAYL